MVILINFVTAIMKSIGVREDKEYIPYIAYYLIKTEPTMLKSTLRFIKLFRNAERLKAAEGQYYSLIADAVSFIEQVNFNDCRMKLEEFDAKYTLCEKMCGARFEELLMVWRHASTLIEKEKQQKEEKQMKVIIELWKILEQTRKLIGKDFERLTVVELKEIAEVQAQVAQKGEELC
eukprot:TRINITY_DN14529_c0_g1_i2.p1 TRINITY_DN14529_c0_g1~~TRINITY_DN14529_c0_g1_i2.p1  ORF type:complete len:177 (+),score=69.90 TRINITY_DN14529_c0_g1_i2:728-1258(+)